MNSSKSIIWICMFIGSAVGGYLPMLWGAGAFSFSGIILSAVGAIGGIYIGFRVSN